MMREYARLRGLRRLLLPVPLLTPHLSGLWLALVTPAQARVGRALVEGLKNATVVRSTTARDVFRIEPLSLSEALRRAIEDGSRARQKVDTRTTEVDVPPAQAFAPIRRIGGATGWYFGTWLWSARSALDRLFGGTGMQRGRRDPEHCVEKDVIDGWTVETWKPDRRLRLAAGLKLPGRGWLDFEVTPLDDAAAAAIGSASPRVQYAATGLFDPTAERRLRPDSSGSRRSSGRRPSDVQRPEPLDFPPVWIAPTSGLRRTVRSFNRRGIGGRRARIGREYALRGRWGSTRRARRPALRVVACMAANRRSAGKVRRIELRDPVMTHNSQVYEAQVVATVYVYWRTEPVGRSFAPGFTPELTPKAMLRLGVFGGKYMTDCRGEFPASWFRASEAVRRTPRRETELFPRQRLAVARRMAAERVDSPQDPRGWFQWYCRYYMGRRSKDDERQIRRWRAIARHASAIRKHCEPWRSRVPPEAKTGVAALGLRQQEDMTPRHSHRHLIVPARRRRALRRRTQARRVSHRDVRAIRGMGAGVP